jgi:hypothetical protein
MRHLAGCVLELAILRKESIERRGKIEEEGIFVEFRDESAWRWSSLSAFLRKARIFLSFSGRS